jgi:hypothetical protein
VRKQQTVVPQPPIGHSVASKFVTTEKTNGQEAATTVVSAVNHGTLAPEDQVGKSMELTIKKNSTEETW